MKIAMVGFGEVGKILSAGLIKQPGVDSISAWDLLFTNASQSQGQVEFAKEHQITIGASLQETIHNADLVISAVTASNTFSVAKEVSQFIQQGSYFLDLNSASPGTKKECAQEIDQRGAFYVEAGVMTSVPPYGIKVPMLLGGEKAQALTEILLQWGMDAKTVSKELGIASAIKMSRSVMIKGLESLIVEAYTTARFYGVEDYVLPTLLETFPQIVWSAEGAYMFSRVVQHGRRRSEEMRESARTVQETGVTPLMASAIAEKQAWVAQLASKGVFKSITKTSSWQDYADCLLAEIHQKTN